MTNLENTLTALNAAQDAFSPIAKELDFARAALKRSKSKANIARFTSAEHAFDAALEVCDAAHEAVTAAEEHDAAICADAAKAEDAAIQPSFF